MSENICPEFDGIDCRHNLEGKPGPLPCMIYPAVTCPLVQDQDCCRGCPFWTVKGPRFCSYEGPGCFPYAQQEMNDREKRETSYSPSCLDDEIS